MLLITFDPENRLVARGLETEWENRLRDLAAAESELRRREQQRPSAISPEQLKAIQRLGSDIRQVWSAPTTTDRDRKELLRALLEEVILNLKRTEGQAQLTLRWRGGAFTTMDVSVPRLKPMGPRTDEDTISLLRRLAALYPDEVIAGILNRQGRKTPDFASIHEQLRSSKYVTLQLLWEEIDYRASRGLDKSVIRALAQKSAWVANHENIFVLGPTNPPTYCYTSLSL